MEHGSRIRFILGSTSRINVSVYPEWIDKSFSAYGVARNADRVSAESGQYPGRQTGDPVNRDRGSPLIGSLHGRNHLPDYRQAERQTGRKKKH